MALQMPMWPWHGLRWAVDYFSFFWEVGLFSCNIGSHLERIFGIVCVDDGYEVLVRDSWYC
jgi:hypothetical protein